NPGMAFPAIPGLSRSGVSRLDGLLQPAQGVGPELREQLSYGLERLVLQGVVATRTLPPFRQQSGLLEHSDVLADGLLGEGEGVRDLPGRQLCVLDQSEDLPTVRV